MDYLKDNNNFNIWYSESGMKFYRCNCCQFNTIYKSSMSGHVKSLRHMEKYKNNVIYNINNINNCVIRNRLMPYNI